MDACECGRTDSHYPVNQPTCNMDEQEWRSCSSAAHNIQEPVRQAMKSRYDLKKDDRMPIPECHSACDTPQREFSPCT